MEVNDEITHINVGVYDVKDMTNPFLMRRL